MTRVLVVDDHPIVLQGCRRVLQDLGIDEISEATEIVQGYRIFLKHRPDIVILDLTFQDDDLGGLTLIRRIATSDPRARILVFSMHNDPAIVSKALEGGAISYVLKDTSSTELAGAVRKVLEGEPYLGHKLAMQVAMMRAKVASQATAHLTAREQQILSLIGRGHSYDQIAERLGISYKTVTNACSAMRGKLQISSLAELIRFSIHNGPDRAA